MPVWVRLQDLLPPWMACYTLNGADYVTIDGLTFTDGNNTNATVVMEFGIALFKRNAGDGCNNNTIQNCTFNMQRINNSGSSGPGFGWIMRHTGIELYGCCCHNGIDANQWRYPGYKWYELE